MDAESFSIRCDDCGAETPIFDAHSGELTEVVAIHEDSCPYLIAIDIGPDAASRYVKEFGNPMMVIKSPHKDN